tara:strand:+ start:64 stop:483 length:420 start_codon:yes stop_codon:yes gene_type:complete
MTVAGANSTPATLADLLDLDLEGRPFLQEQGNTVTRGFVRFLEADEGHWTLAIRDVEYLDKRTGLWAPDTPEDEYGGRLDCTEVSRLWGGQPPIFDRGLQISCYGIFIHIGMSSDRPWRDNDWPELDTEMLSPGPMSDR